MLSLVEGSGNGAGPHTVDAVLDATIGTLGEGSGNPDLTAALTEFGRLAMALDPLQRQIARAAAINALTDDELGDILGPSWYALTGRNADRLIPAHSASAA